MAANDQPNERHAKIAVRRRCRRSPGLLLDSFPPFRSSSSNSSTMAGINIASGVGVGVRQPAGLGVRRPARRQTAPPKLIPPPQHRDGSSLLVRDE
jgi:hypothetical protein